MVVLVVVGAKRRSNGTPDIGGPVAGEAIPGTGTVVRKQVGVGGEVCLHIPPPLAAMITPGTRRTFPARSATSRLYMEPHRRVRGGVQFPAADLPLAGPTARSHGSIRTGKPTLPPPPLPPPPMAMLFSPKDLTPPSPSTPRPLTTKDTARKITTTRTTAATTRRTVTSTSTTRATRTCRHRRRRCHR